MKIRKFKDFLGVLAVSSASAVPAFERVTGNTFAGDMVQVTTYQFNSIRTRVRMESDTINKLVYLYCSNEYTDEATEVNNGVWDSCALGGYTSNLVFSDTAPTSAPFYIQGVLNSGVVKDAFEMSFRVINVVSNNSSFVLNISCYDMPTAIPNTYVAPLSDRDVVETTYFGPDKTASGDTRLMAFSNSQYDNYLYRFLWSNTPTSLYQTLSISGSMTLYNEVTNVNSLNYTKGYNKGKEDGYNSGYATGKEDGYNEGYSKGSTEAINDTGLLALFDMILIAPQKIIGDALDFEFFGINFKSLAFAIITLSLVIMALSLVLKK